MRFSKDKTLFTVVAQLAIVYQHWPVNLKGTCLEVLNWQVEMKASMRTKGVIAWLRSQWSNCRRVDNNIQWRSKAQWVIKPLIRARLLNAQSIRTTPVSIMQSTSLFKSNRLQEILPWQKNSLANATESAWTCNHSRLWALLNWTSRSLLQRTSKCWVATATSTFSLLSILPQTSLETVPRSICRRLLIQSRGQRQMLIKLS